MINPQSKTYFIKYIPPFIIFIILNLFKISLNNILIFILIYFILIQLFIKIIFNYETTEINVFDHKIKIVWYRNRGEYYGLLYSERNLMIIFGYEELLGTICHELQHYVDHLNGIKQLYDFEDLNKGRDFYANDPSEIKARFAERNNMIMYDDKIYDVILEYKGKLIIDIRKSNRKLNELNYIIDIIIDNKIEYIKFSYLTLKELEKCKDKFEAKKYLDNYLKSLDK